MPVWPARAAMLVWPARAAMSSRLLRRALSSAPRSPPARPPLRLGALGGPCIANKASVLHEVDRALNPDDPRPPDVEVLLADHLAYTGNPLSRALHHNLIALGHLLVRYTTSDGKQWVMNILGGDALDRGGRMVNFGRPEDYLYGTAAYDGWCQQGGVYNRDFVGVRIERAPEGVADALHAYYRVRAPAARGPSARASANGGCGRKAPHRPRAPCRSAGPGDALGDPHGHLGRLGVAARRAAQPAHRLAGARALRALRRPDQQLHRRTPAARGLHAARGAQAPAARQRAQRR